MKGNNIIGIYYFHGVGSLCTIDELGDIFVGQTRFTAEQICDFRCKTHLNRFKYDPFTGELIDWKDVQRKIEL